MEYKVICEMWEHNSLSNQFTINAIAENWTEALNKVQITLNHLNTAAQVIPETENIIYKLSSRETLKSGN